MIACSMLESCTISPEIMSAGPNRMVPQIRLATKDKNSRTKSTYKFRYVMDKDLMRLSYSAIFVTRCPTEEPQQSHPSTRPLVVLVTEEPSHLIVPEHYPSAPRPSPAMAGYGLKGHSVLEQVQVRV